MSGNEEQPIGLGLDFAMMAMCLADGPLQIAEEKLLLAMFRYRAKGSLSPGKMLETLASLRTFVHGLDEAELARLLVGWGKSYPEHGGDLLDGLVKQAMCDSPICLKEKRFLAAAAWWIEIEDERLLEWHRGTQAKFQELIAGGAHREQLVSSDAMQDLEQ